MMGRNSNNAKGVLLDVDGVLLDSFNAFKTVWREWSELRGLDFEMLWAATHGRRPVDTIAEIAPHLDAETEYAWLQQRVKHPDLEFPAFQGAAEFLSSLPRDTWALVTSSHEDAVRMRFNIAGLPHPTHIVDATRVDQGKPLPQCYELGASLLGVSPENCFVVEDAPAGITAGRDAGCYVVAVKTTHEHHELQDAHEVVDSIADARRAFERWVG